MLAARRDRLIHESPCAGVRLPRADRASSSLTVLTAAQVAALADEVPHRYRALVLVSAGLGLRQGEACGLTVDRIDFLRRRVTHRPAGRHAAEGESTATSVRSRRRARTACCRCRRSSPRCSPPTSPSSARAADRLLFTTSTGAMLSRQTWHGAFSAAAERLGIDASSHDLRHHAASLLIASGCSPRPSRPSSATRTPPRRSTRTHTCGRTTKTGSRPRSTRVPTRCARSVRADRSERVIRPRNPARARRAAGG